MEKGNNLDAIPSRPANDPPPGHTAAATSGRDNIPPFSSPIFLAFLADFIIVDDQSLSVVECREFRRLLLLLKEDLKDKDIPHRTKIQTEVIQAWKRYFDCLKKDLAVRVLIFVQSVSLIRSVNRTLRAQQGTYLLRPTFGPVMLGGLIWL